MLMMDFEGQIEKRLLKGLLDLLYYMDGVYFFAKDSEGRFIAANERFIRRSGVSSSEELMGKTDFDFFPRSLAESYVEDDSKIIESGKPIINKVELFPNEDGVQEWFQTNKVPLVDNGVVYGLAGITRSYEGSVQAVQPYLDIAPAVDYIKENFRSNISISELSELVNLSGRHLARKFRQILNTTPKQYIIKMRILEACDLLITSNLSITEIALKIGFYDHSTFTNHFTALMDMPPRDYRKYNISKASFRRT